jgi:hypothetical protein
MNVNMLSDRHSYECPNGYRVKDSLIRALPASLVIVAVQVGRLLSHSTVTTKVIALEIGSSRFLKKNGTSVVLLPKSIVRVELFSDTFMFIP